MTEVKFEFFAKKKDDPSEPKPLRITNLSPILIESIYCLYFFRPKESMAHHIAAKIIHANNMAADIVIAMLFIYFVC